MTDLTAEAFCNQLASALTSLKSVDRGVLYARLISPDPGDWRTTVKHDRLGSCHLALDPTCLRCNATGQVAEKAGTCF